MISLRTSAAMERALCLPLDATLRSLLEQRMEQLRRHWSGDLGEIVEFHIVERGDTPRQITSHLGWDLLAEEFAPEWGQCHAGRWFELVHTWTEDFGSVIFVENHPATEGDVHAFCLDLVCCPP